MDKLTYYMYHVTWNSLLSFLLQYPFTAAFYLYFYGKFNWDVFFVNILTSVCTGFFNITIGSFFQNDTSGLNFIGLFNMVVSITGSYGIENSFIRTFKQVLPQNFMITYFGDLVKLQGDTSSLPYFQVLFLQILAYLLIFHAIEKFLPNEYGYREKTFVESFSSIFKSLVPEKERLDNRRPTETELTSLVAESPDSPEETSDLGLD